MKEKSYKTLKWICFIGWTVVGVTQGIMRSGAAGILPGALAGIAFSAMAVWIGRDLARPWMNR